MESKWAPPEGEILRRRAPIYQNPENPGLSELEVPGRVQDDEGVEVDAARGVEARSGRQGGRCGGGLPVGVGKAGGASHQGRHRQHGQPCTGATWFLIGGAQPCSHLSDADLVHYIVLSLPSETFFAPTQCKHSALARSSSVVNMLLDMVTSLPQAATAGAPVQPVAAEPAPKADPDGKFLYATKVRAFPASPSSRLAGACHRLHAAHQSMIPPLHVLLHDGTRLIFSSCQRRQHTLTDISTASTESVLN